jgi:hypothetical protein
MPEEAKGRLSAARFAAKDYETLRRERTVNAMNKKLPKLACLEDPGARSILILDRDCRQTKRL